MLIRFFSLVVVLAFTGRCAGGDDFFETKIRPVLAANCFKCHGPTKQKGDIRLDAPEHLRSAGDGSGPVVVPGKPQESRLIKAVRHKGEHAMPPGKKLPAAVIRDLVEWVKAGAQWPAVHGKPAVVDHWAFKPVQAPNVPEVKAGDWPASDLDRFVLAKLEAKGLTPSPSATDRVLLRRLTFDLVGLPPTPKQLDDLARAGPNGYDKLVDQLLGSPAFGERWGRHWLDVARYSDTKGAIDGEDSRYPSAYTYRDWVVKAFNDDLPFDQFLIEQLAADLLARGESHPSLAALGFLTLGRKFENNEPDVIDDRLDAIFRGMQGLTLSCARCHDHKYDPIPIQDYYSLYGVFAGAREREVPIIVSAADRTRYLTYAAELRSRVRSLNRFDEGERRKLYGFHPAQAERYLLAAHSGGGAPAEEGGAREDGLKQAIVDRYHEFLSDSRSERHPVMAPWHAFAKWKPGQTAERKKLAKRFADNADEEKPINPLVARLFTSTPPKDLTDMARRYGRLFTRIARKWQRTLDDADRRDVERPDRLVDEDEDEIRQLFFGKAGEPPLSDGVDNIADVLPEEKQEIPERLRNAVNDWKNGANVPPMAHILVDPDEVEPAKVFIRGNPDQPGDETPRQFLAVLAGKDRKPFRDGTGRLELAKAIANSKNPLTARVWVNRVWGRLIGRPLVETTSDFGRRSAAPTHPELLDWLAQSLVDNGWSTKQLIRRIVLSKTYRQASSDRTDAHTIDPTNVLLWRMNRKRLELEPFRDALLAASGNLKQKVGGRPIDPILYPLAARRTLYLTVDRGNLATLHRTFDFANPDLHSAGRHETTDPRQALFLLNSPFAIAQARGLAKRAAAGDPPETEFLRRMYRIALTREPTSDERTTATKFLRSAAGVKNIGPERPPVVWMYGVGKWDAAGQRLIAFTALPHFQDDQWRGGPEYPDPRLNYSALSADGGHPGENRDQVVVRRWIAPADGTAVVTGKLAHKMPENEKSEEADGVKGYVVAGGKVAAEADVFNKEATTNARDVRLRAGDAIDFIIDPKANNSYDDFTWRVHVGFTPANKPGTEIGYDSAEDFRGPPPPTPPPLSPREKLAQVLLMTNEFLYID